MQDPRVAKCLAAKRESRAIEFKEEFSPTDARQSLEVLKDLVAIANSGGGALVVGVNNSGEASGADVKPVLDYDHAKYCDLIHKYTSQNFCDFEVVGAEKDGQEIAIFLINPPEYPLIFAKPGSYPVEGSKYQQTAFSQGMIVSRHGAKSEAATTDDLRKFMQLRIKEMRDQMMKGLRSVAESPRGSELRVVPAGASENPAVSTAVRLTTDPEAKQIAGIDKGVLFPHRQKEVIALIRKRLPNSHAINSRDLLAVNKVYGLPERADFSWKPEFSSRQYSDAYVDWLVRKMEGDEEFLLEAKRRFYEINHPPSLPFA